MKSLLILALALLSFLVLTGCSSVTFRPRENRRIQTYADAELKHDYYLLGSVGRFEVDAKQLCNGANPRQMQSLFTTQDQLFSLVTLGIYTPRTLRIWCY